MKKINVQMVEDGYITREGSYSSKQIKEIWGLTPAKFMKKITKELTEDVEANWDADPRRVYYVIKNDFNASYTYIRNAADAAAQAAEDAAHRDLMQRSEVILKDSKILKIFMYMLTQEEEQRSLASKALSDAIADVDPNSDHYRDLLEILDHSYYKYLFTEMQLYNKYTEDDEIRSIRINKISEAGDLVRSYTEDADLRDQIKDEVRKLLVLMGVRDEAEAYALARMEEISDLYNAYEDAEDAFVTVVDEIAEDAKADAIADADAQAAEDADADTYAESSSALTWADDAEDIF